MYQVCVYRGPFLRLVHADRSDRLEREVRNGPIFYIPQPSLCSPLLSRGHRLYAITMKSVIVTSFFSCITVSQFVLGIYLTNLAANAPGTASYERFGGDHPHSFSLKHKNSLPSTSRPISYVYSPGIGRWKWLTQQCRSSMVCFFQKRPTLTR